MSGIERRALIVGVVGAGVAAVFKTEDAMAADSNLSLADAACEKAIALLKLAKGTGNPPFGGHRENAINHLEHARKEIAKAKQWADNPPNDKPHHPDKGKHKGEH